MCEVLKRVGFDDTQQTRAPPALICGHLQLCDVSSEHDQEDENEQMYVTRFSVYKLNAIASPWSCARGLGAAAIQKINEVVWEGSKFDFEILRSLHANEEQGGRETQMKTRARARLISIVYMREIKMCVIYWN